MLDDSAAIPADSTSGTSRGSAAPPPPPPAPEDVASNDELFLLGLHLEERPRSGCAPEHYWEEAVWRDPGDTRCHVALARSLAVAARFDEAEGHLRSAIERLTSLGVVPADGEAHHRLGELLARQGRPEEALEALSTARRARAWRVASGVALGRLLLAADRLEEAEAVLREVRAIDGQHAPATVLLAVVLRRGRRAQQSRALLESVLARDPLDHWARDLAGRPLDADADALLDVALEYRDAGLPDDALRLLALALAADAARRTPSERTGVVPLVHYHAALLHERQGRPDQARAARRTAQQAPLEGCRPVRLEDVEALEAADTEDTTARFLLGGWYAAVGRVEDAFAASWAAAAHDPRAWVRVAALRALGAASCTAYGDAEAGLAYLERARHLAPDDAGLLVEYDRLRVLLGHEGRLALLEENEALVLERDDLTLEYAALLVADGRAGRAQGLLLGRVLGEGEGPGSRIPEGRVLEVWDATMIALADASSPADALTFLCAALAPPACLGEERPLSAVPAGLLLRRGAARARLGDDAGAADDWEAAAGLTGDAVTAPRYDEQTVSAIRALLALGRRAEADRLMTAFSEWIDVEAAVPATADWTRPGELFPLEPQQQKDALLARCREQLAALAEERRSEGGAPGPAERS
ncbi:hypothetical protein EDF36_1607 [Rathayibacter sp. PhB152]|uniref:tetratricopeptide repeat protein n=1 Tax=Rathayibacter sp. PhB152 TaxID=2485190 RepID=UPI000F4CF2E3|nr:hypothetical protein [Rathayibacter sp. PhB152]ROQ60468.1 hypothetical protein EDF36_1607 [Rathayibacter sp. PhB152]